MGQKKLEGLINFDKKKEVLLLALELAVILNEDKY